MTIRHIGMQQLFCLQQSIPGMTGNDGYTLFNPYKRTRTHAYRAYIGKPVITRHPSWEAGHGR
jgi:hypothetical protein